MYDFSLAAKVQLLQFTPLFLFIISYLSHKSACLFFVFLLLAFLLEQWWWQPDVCFLAHQCGLRNDSVEAH